MSVKRPPILGIYTEPSLADARGDFGRHGAHVFLRILIHLLLCLGGSAVGLADSVLYFPRMVSGPDAYTGFAITNPTDQAAELTLTAYDENGRRIQGPEVRNPAVVTLAAHRQVSYLDWEVFHFSEPVAGWIYVVSPTTGLVGSFLFGDTQGASLDGAD